MKCSFLLSSLIRPLALCGLFLASIATMAHAQTNGWFVELAGSSQTSNDSLYQNSAYFGSGDSKADMVGGDISFGYMNGSSGGLVFTLGAAVGSFDTTGVDLMGNASTGTSDLTSAQAMIGYRYSYRLSSSLSVYVGAHVGVSSMSITAANFMVTSPTTGLPTSLNGDSESDIGYSYAFETGVTLHFSDSFYLFGSYILSSSSAAPELKLHSGESVTMEDQSYQTFRIGVGFSF